MSEPTKEDLRTMYCRGADPFHMICWDVLGADIDEDGLRAVYEAGLAAARAEGKEVYVLWYTGSPKYEAGPCGDEDTGELMVFPNTATAKQWLDEGLDEEDRYAYEVRSARLILSPGEGGKS